MVQFTNIFVASISLAAALPAFAAPHPSRATFEVREADVEYVPLIMVIKSVC